MTNEEVINLITWYQDNKRKLPWRKTKDPYKIWISEIMLQQTRVEAVISYYQRFLKKVPDLVSLSKIKEEQLLKLWEGLGYYSRAKNLKKCATFLVQNGYTTLPNQYEALLQLPGIGPYTAGAISSIAFDLPHAAVDGNVLRVFSRRFKEEQDILSLKVRTKYQTMIEQMMQNGHTREITEGLMELGATVCVPNGKPLCSCCPLQKTCLAHQERKELEYPIKKKKKTKIPKYKTVLIFSYNNKVYLTKRKKEGLLSDFHEFFILDNLYYEEELKQFLKQKKLNYSKYYVLGQKKHIFSNEEWLMLGYLIELNEPLNHPDYKAVSLTQLKKKIPLPVVYQKYAILLDNLNHSEETLV